MSRPSLLLAIECATRVASVALARDGEVLAVRSTRSDQHHAQTLLPEIDAVFSQLGAALADVDAFAVSIGPGAFTSLRIGLSTLKGLAFASERPVAAISTLACIAHAAPREAARVAALLDARRGEVYVGQFERQPGDGRQGSSEVLQLVGEEGVRTAVELARELERDTLLVGEIPTGFLEALAAAGRPDLRHTGPAGPGPRAASLAALGLRALERGEAVSASGLVPRYLRRADAEEKRLAASSSLDTAKKLQ